MTTFYKRRATFSNVILSSCGRLGHDYFKELSCDQPGHDMSGRSNELNSGILASLGEVGSLGQEAVAGVNGIDVVLLQRDEPSS